LEQRLIGLLERHDGNVAVVARDAARAPAQVARWVKRFQIDPNAFRRR